MTEAEVLSVLRQKVRDVGSLSKAAHELGTTPSFLNDVIADPPRRPLTSPKLLEGLSLRIVTSYEPLAGPGRVADTKTIVFLAQLAAELTETDPAVAHRLRSHLDDFGYPAEGALVAALVAADA